jgi:ATP-dependent DNA helicase PIF1
MWVKAREREKNKEKCVNGATFLTVLGGIGVLLFGDFAQLPPVGDSPLYSSKVPLKPLLITGKDVYLSLNQSITLQQIFHQQGDDFISQHFHNLLLRQ